MKRSGSRLPLALNGFAAAVMLGLIALFGFQAALAPPPTVAALQPPSRQLKEAPPEQSVVELPGQVNPSPTPSAGASPAPSQGTIATATRQCYQLTQTPDPQSPPCRQGWDPSKQDNGGATAQGVTREKIYVSFPCNGGFFERCIDTKWLAQYFNTHFEFWGRQLVINDPWCPTWDSTGGCAGPPGADKQVAHVQGDATTAAHWNDSNGGVFASLAYVPEQGDEHYYYDTLANQYRIASISSVPNSEAEAHYQQYHPYEWSVTPTMDYAEQNLGQFLCRTMAGRAPQWAQATSSWQPPSKRGFAVVWSTSPDHSNPLLSPLTNVLQGCSGAATTHVMQFDGSTTSATQLVTQMMKEGDTTVTCVCGDGSLKTTLANAANNQGYRPEWVVWPFGFQDVDSTYFQYTDANCACQIQQWPQDQQSDLIGFSDFNKILPPDEEFWFQAIREANQAYGYGDNGADIYDYYRYEELMVLATGIQMAGPHLTPQTFAAALQNYPSRDPGHGHPPYFQAQVGFTSGHGWIQDFAPVYWSSTAQNYTTQEPRSGSLCYVSDSGSGLGVRFGLNQWPDHQLDFYPGGNTPCR